MNYEMIEKLKKLLEKQLEKSSDQVEKRGSWDANSLNEVHVMTDTIKNLYKICALDAQMNEDYPDVQYSQRRDSRGRYSREGGYSGRDDMYGRDGGYSRDYNGGNSYANRGQHYVRGHYSRGSEKEHIADQLEDLLDSTSDENLRKTLEQALQMATK